MEPKTKVKFPDIRKYRISPEGLGTKAIEYVIRDIKAAHDLNLPFTVKTELEMNFVGGGNIDKAECFNYVVIIGEIVEK